MHQPAKGTRVALGKASGFTLAVPALTPKAAAQHVTIRSADAAGGKWQGRQAGAVRATPFGNEAIVVTPTYTEQFLTVDRRYGVKTWKWQIDSSVSVPRVGDDGYVAFIKDHKVMQDLLIKPVEIYDAKGNIITPTGARWSLAQYGNKR